MSRVHIVGAGLAGLSAAVSLAREGRAVIVHEAAARAGGRCRSHVDARLGRVVDNGNHLVLSGNRSTARYLEETEASDALVGPATARFPFLDLRTGRRWTVRPNAGRVPWWILHAGRRVPGTSAREYLSAFRLARVGPDRTVADCVGDCGVLFERFWEPLAVAVLNTPAAAGAAALLWPVLRETFARGEAGCRPRIARVGLSHAFVDPALAFLGRHGVTVRLRSRLRGIDCTDGRARRLDFGGETVALQDGDRVILAVPPGAAAALVPSLTVPEASSTIVNAHFRLPEPAPLPPELPFLGLIGGTAQWIFVRGDVASITISAADALAAEPAEALARRTWADVAAAFDRDPDALPPWRVVKERRATFAQTPAQVRRRPGTRTAFSNVFLAGDWVDTVLPATIEGAIRSGHMAARAAHVRQDPRDGSRRRWGGNGGATRMR